MKPTKDAADTQKSGDKPEEKKASEYEQPKPRLFDKSKAAGSLTQGMTHKEWARRKLTGKLTSADRIHTKKAQAAETADANSKSPTVEINSTIAHKGKRPRSR